MNPSYTYTALIDVLSYRFRLEQDVKSGTFSFKDDLISALSVLNDINSSIFGVQAISDTIILTCTSHDQFSEFLEILRSIFLAFLKRGLFIRGGIAYSKHFQSGRITYSHAVARAYEIENKIATYPRIVIDSNIIQMFESEMLPNIFGKGLLAEHNGVTFLNVLNRENWREYFELASRLYDKDRKFITTNESAFSKHQWFEKYLFDCLFADHSAERYIDLIRVN